MAGEEVAEVCDFALMVRIWWRRWKPIRSLLRGLLNSESNKQ
jgi:hypothetical protein